MRNNTGFSLVELLIALVTAAVLALMLSAFGSVGFDFFQKSRQEANIFDDMSYSLAMLEDKVRAAGGLAKASAVVSPWIIDSGIYRLDVGALAAFGVVSEAGSTARRFVYCPDKGVPNSHQMLFRVPNLDTDNYINFTFTCSPNVNCTFPRSVTVTLSGKRDRIPFSISSQIKRRPL